MSRALERFLIARGERVVPVSTRLMAGTRRSSRERGKSWVDPLLEGPEVKAAATRTAISPSMTARRGKLCRTASTTSGK
jgi:hypothetical protein